MTDRKYLPTFAELVDRLSIVLLKSIFIPENRKTYREEIELILHDINVCLNRPDKRNFLLARDIYAIMTIMLVNREIWRNESEARKGNSQQDKLLKFTHSINGVRAAAKNVLAQSLGERLDLKADSLAADLPAEFGNWNVFSDD